MSIVVHIASKNHRGCAGDGREWDDENDYKYDKSRKVYKIRTGLFGFAGDAESEIKLKSILKDNEDPTVDGLKMPKGSYDSYFLSTNGNIYTISNGVSAICTKSQGVYCAGAGAQYAYGAIYGYCQAKKWKIGKLNKSQVMLLVRLGCRAAIEMNKECGGRVRSLYMEVA